MLVLVAAALMGHGFAQDTSKASKGKQATPPKIPPAQQKVPVINAGSAIIVEAETGQVLWEKNADKSRFPASTTKIMTAMLLLENCLPGDILTAPSDVEQVTGSSLHLKKGEKVNAHDLLFSLLIRSANDGCHTIADHISGSDAEFVKLMNKRAVELGCKKTNFHNPHGLNDDKHTTTARDLSIIARAALAYPDLREAARTKTYTVSRSLDSKDVFLKTKNPLLLKDKVDGIKTGWTVPAGHCFVGTTERDGVRLIVVILKSDQWTDDTMTCIDWAYAHFKKANVVEKDGDVGSIPLQNGDKPSLALTCGEPVLGVVPIDNSATIEKVILPYPMRYPIVKGDFAGWVIVRDATTGQAFGTAPAFAAESVDGPHGGKSISGVWSTLTIAGVLVAGFVWHKKKAHGY